TLAKQRSAESQTRPERVELSADDVVECRKNASPSYLEFIAAGLGLQIGCASGRSADLGGVRVVFDMNACGRFDRYIESKIAADRIGNIRPVHRVGALARPSSFDVISSVHSTHHARC